MWAMIYVAEEAAEEAENENREATRQHERTEAPQPGEHCKPLLGTLGACPRRDWSSVGVTELIHGQGENRWRMVFGKGKEEWRGRMIAVRARLGQNYPQRGGKRCARGVRQDGQREDGDPQRAPPAESDCCRDRGARCNVGRYASHETVKQNAPRRPE